MKVGYIGLGALGGELARCFMRGYELQVWDIDGAARERFGQLGVPVAATAEELGRRCDAVLLCLPRSAHVREVIFGPAGLAEGLSAGKLVIDQSSGVPQETREMAQRLAQRGVSMLDAAVSASPHVVAAGGATLMAGGSAEALALARPLLEAITRNVIHCGERVGDGQAMKMVNNAMNGGCRLGTLELVALGRKAGLSLAAMTQALNQGSGRNQTTEKMLPAIARGEASTNFALALMLKDLNQAVQLGMTLGVPMPLTRTARALLQVGLNTRGSAARLEDMVGVVETMAAARFADGPGGGADGALLDLVDQSVWAVCHALARECMAAGVAYGLATTAMATVLARASGWSYALHEICRAIGGERPAPERRLLDVTALLQEVTTLSIRHDAPVLLANAAAGVFEQAVQQFGAQTPVHRLVQPRPFPVSKEAMP